MNLIGDLRIAIPEHGGFRYPGFQKLANELAIEIRPVWVKNPTKPDTDDLLRQLDALLEHSDAFYIRDWRYFPELHWLNQHHWVPGIALAVESSDPADTIDMALHDVSAETAVCAHGSFKIDDGPLPEITEARPV